MKVAGKPSTLVYMSAVTGLHVHRRRIRILTLAAAQPLSG